MEIIEFINKASLTEFRSSLNEQIRQIKKDLIERRIPTDGSFKVELLRKGLDEKIWGLLLNFNSGYNRSYSMPQPLRKKSFSIKKITPEEKEEMSKFLRPEKPTVHNLYVDESVHKIKDVTDDFQSNLSNESQEFIDTSELVFQQIENFGGDVDYSACAIGIWKAIEWELNLVFIDWLRNKNMVCSQRPTQGNHSIIPGVKVLIPSGQRADGRDYTININITNYDGNLLGIMLYYISKLLEYSENNDLKELLDGRLSELRNDILGIDENSLPKQILKVTQEYRNRYVHSDGMDLDVFNEFHDFVFNDTENGMINKIIRYKRLIYN